MQNTNQSTAQATQTATVKNLMDDDYTLTEGRAWFTVQGFAVRIHTTDEGLIVDIYQNGKEYNAPISSAYAHIHDLEPEE